MEIRSVGRRLLTDIDNDITKLETVLANPKKYFEEAHKVIEEDFCVKRRELQIFRDGINKAKRIHNEQELIDHLTLLCSKFTGEIPDIRTIYATFEEILEDLSPGEITIG